MVAGVKSVGADKNIREVKIECKAVFINYTGDYMSIFELFLTACGLSMDAFAVSVTNGLCVRKGESGEH